MCLFHSEPPKISSFLRREQLVVVVNGVLELDCIADGFPPPTVSWMKDGHPLEDSRVVLHRDGQILTISNIQVLIKMLFSLVEVINIMLIYCTVQMFLQTHFHYTKLMSIVV